MSRRLELSILIYLTSMYVMNHSLSQTPNAIKYETVWQSRHMMIIKHANLIGLDHILKPKSGLYWREWQIWIWIAETSLGRFVSTSASAGWKCEIWCILLLQTSIYFQPLLKLLDQVLQCSVFYPILDQNYNLCFKSKCCWFSFLLYSVATVIGNL